MKRLLLLSMMSFFIITRIGAQCPTANILLSTQSQIDNFADDYPSCTILPVSLTIREENLGGITNLSGLSQLTGITGSLRILDNRDLPSLMGLNQLTIVSDSLIISNNDAINDLSGLSALSIIGGEFEVSENENIANLSGSLLAEVGDGIKIQDNPSLLTLIGLELIDDIPASLDIQTNDLLENLDGLNNLLTVGFGVIVGWNYNLTDISALNNLTSIGTGLTLASLAVTDYNGFPNLTYLGGALRIEGHSELMHVSGFNSLSSIEDYLYIQSNTRLEDVTGFQSLTEVNDLTILSSTLRHFNGLSSLTTIRRDLSIYTCDSLETLQGLSNVTHLGGNFNIGSNGTISSLAGTENIDFGTVDFLFLGNNANLTMCAQTNICLYLANGGPHTIGGNAPSCNESSDLLIGCETLPTTLLEGHLLADLNGDCLGDAASIAIADWPIEIRHQDYTYTLTTDDEGYYRMLALSGENTLNLIPASPYWESCFADTLVVASFLDTINTDFLVVSQGDCSYLDWQTYLSPLRVCDENTMTIRYCSEGAEMSEDLVFSVALDSLLEVVDSSIPFVYGQDSTLLFTIDSIGLFECDYFTITTFLNCEEAMIGDFPCVAVNLISEELCAPDSLWDGSLVTATGFCLGDSIHFDLRNIGSGNMSQPAQFRTEIVIDDIILMLDADDYQLDAGGEKRLSYPIQGQGMRLEADQTPNHPFYEEVSALVPNCDNPANNELITQIPMNNGDPFSETFCAPAINSYDPNIKSATPTGLGLAHEIDKDWQLNYTVQFQNTGNDLAYLVVIKDTLSENIDLSTLEIGSASHTFSWSLNPNRELIFTFDNINLPDSTSNEPESHGYIHYSISPKASLSPGLRIDNTAAIYFDFNDPIITNTVTHTIRKPVVVTSQRETVCSGEIVDEQVIMNDTTLQYLTAYLEYDSVHFKHLEVLLPQTSESIEVNMAYGDTFQEVLIENDTSFTISYIAENQCDSLVTYHITSTRDQNALFQTIKLYPNPVAGQLNITNQQNEEPQYWRLINKLGQVIWQTQLAPYEKLGAIQVGSFPAGIYWLEVQTDRERQIWKVVVH